MYPVLFNIGPVSVYSFGLLLSIGLIFGVYYAWKQGRASNLAEEKLLDTSILVILGGLVGSRILYVWSNWPSFVDDLLAVPQFWKGGLSFWGALIGGVITILILSRRLHWPAGSLFDLAAPSVAIGASFGYVGALLNGSAFGAETTWAWGIRLQGLPGLRNPSQLLEAGLQLVLLLVLLRLRPRAPFAGFLALTYLTLYSIGRFGLEFLRGDATLVLGRISQAQIFSLFVGTVSLLLLYLRLARLQGSWRVSIRRILARSNS